jgi:hypothetical protein
VCRITTRGSSQRLLRSKLWRGLAGGLGVLGGRSGGNGMRVWSLVEKGVIHKGICCTSQLHARRETEPYSFRTRLMYPDDNVFSGKLDACACKLRACTVLNNHFLFPSPISCEILLDFKVRMCVAMTLHVFCLHCLHRFLSNSPSPKVTRAIFFPYCVVCFTLSPATNS